MDIDLILTDQDKGIELMRRGEVLATLCADGTPINGARVDKLGFMRYRAYANEAFLSRFNLIDNFENLYKAPALIFNEDDQLQHRYLAKLKQPEPQNPIKCPSTEGFLQLAASGCGFGLMPEIQVNQSILNDQLIDISPATYLDIPLFWHSWRSSGDVMKRLRSSVIKTAHRWLRSEF